MKRAAGLALFQKSVMGLGVHEMPMTGVTLLPQTQCVSVHPRWRDSRIESRGLNGKESPTSP